MSYLAGERCNQSRLAGSPIWFFFVPPLLEAQQIPSTDWEETFPSALSLTAQCHNSTSVFTAHTHTPGRSLSLYVDLGADVKANSALTFQHTVAVNSKSVAYFFFFFFLRPSLDVPLSPLSFRCSPPLGRSATRKAECSRESRGGPTEALADVSPRRVKLVTLRILHPWETFKIIPWLSIRSDGR